MTLRAVLLLCLLAAPAVAQPEGFAPFWSEFSAAAKAGDKAKVRALAKLPFPGNDASFDSIWKDVFTSKARACLGKGKPIWDKVGKNHVIFCGEVGFYFEKTDAGWRFTDIHPND